MSRAWWGGITAVLVTVAAGQGPVTDDFSHGGWTRFPNTPGTMTAEAGKLRLVDGPEEPEWTTVSKTFAVDFDRAPIFMVRVTAVSDRGTVKLIRQKPFDKRTAIEIDRPGLYAVDLHKQFGWTGVGDVETCLYTIGDQSEITYEFVKYAASLTAAEQQLVAERATGGNTRLTVAPFEVVPSFCACSYYFQSPLRPAVAVLYRRAGGAWQPAYPPVYVAADQMYRGSVVRLDEDTPYELKLTDGQGQTLAQQEFRTWRSEVPVAKTIVLDDQNFAGHLKITDQGTPQGWIRYTAKDGFVLRNDRSGPLLELSRAKYVLLDGLTLRGGLKQIITLKQCEQVRVVNCDLAGWGRLGTQRFDLDGKYYTPAGEAINWDTAILISKCVGTVIERCYIHDPVSTANSWYYSHPAGPQALGIDKPRATVVRYNDFIGSDDHRWNDAIEGSDNFATDGGFNRDADVYGNLFCFANDDGVELDGGQTNVRAFDNWSQGCLCGISIQGCMSGPSYVFNNLLVNLGDQRGLAGQTIKTSSNTSGPGAVSLIFGNTCFGESSDLQLLRHLRIIARNNIFAGRSNLTGRNISPQSDCDYNLQANGKAGEEAHGLAAEPGFVDADASVFTLRPTSAAVGHGQPLDNFTPTGSNRIDLGAIPPGSNRVLPLRPLPVSVDRPQLRFSAADTAAARAQTVTATVQGDGFSSRYQIAQNEAFDWFTVSPASGQLASGQPQTFTVTVLPAKMTKRRLYQGAFLIRLPNGCSRPVMVAALTSFTPAVRPARDGVWTQYLEAEAGTGAEPAELLADPAASGGRYLHLAARAQAKPVEYPFSVPTKGKYYVLLRLKSADAAARCSVQFGLDDAPLDRSQLRSAASWTWCLAAHNKAMSLICLESFDLRPGAHLLKLAARETVDVDLVAVTDNPGIFE